MTDDGTKLSVEEVEETLNTLQRLGLVEDSGERRGGKIVWRITKRGEDQAYRAQAVTACEKAEELEHFTN